MDKQKDKKDKKSKERIIETKWKSLKDRGINRPSSEAENIQRIKDAHGF